MSKKEFKWSKINYGDEDKPFINWYGYYGREELGYLEYWKPWKKWVWNQGEGIIMSKSCLNEVMKKIDVLVATGETEGRE